MKLFEGKLSINKPGCLLYYFQYFPFRYIYI